MDFDAASLADDFSRYDNRNITQMFNTTNSETNAPHDPKTLKHAHCQR